MKKALFNASLFVMTPFIALAQDADEIIDTNVVKSVPEISALEGTAALAVIATVVLIAWERRRRAV